MTYRETIADNLSASGWTWGYSSQIDSTGRVLFTADAYRDNGKRFIFTADEKLTAFIELESAIRSLKVRVARKTGNIFLKRKIPKSPI